MKRNCLIAVFARYKPVQTLCCNFIRLLLSTAYRCSPVVRTFCQSERGAFVIIFALMFPVILGLIVWQIESVRLIYNKARLSDALEQAALALTVEDNPDDLRNQTLVRNYINAYMPDARIHIVWAERKHEDSKVVWRPHAITRHRSWFPASEYIPGSEVKIEGNAGAHIMKVIRDDPEPMAVVFVVDFSSSMGHLLKKARPGSQEHESKYWQLKQIIESLANKVYQHPQSQVGFVPFALGVTERASDGSYRCTIPWYSNRPITDVSVARNTFSGRYDDKVMEDHDRLQDIIHANVNIDETLKNIMVPAVDGKTVSIPREQVGYYFCQHYWTDGQSKAYWPQPPTAQLYVIPLTRTSSALATIQQMKPLGNTFTTAGILAGVKLFHDTRIKNKRLIIVSDGEESIYLDLTKKFISRGLCKEIKKQGIEMEFIGIEYPSPEKRAQISGHHWVDWENTCVGSDHFYTPDTMQTLEDALHRAVLPNLQQEIGRNVVKR